MWWIIKIWIESKKSDGPEFWIINKIIIYYKHKLKGRKDINSLEVIGIVIRKGVEGKGVIKFSKSS